MNILIIGGHPRKNSLCNALVDAYVQGAQEGGHDIKSIKLAEHGSLNYNLIEGEGDGDPLWAQRREDVLWAEHLVFVFPTRWYTVPGCLKGRFDKIFLPKFSHQYTGYMKWKKLLGGRTGSVISTCGGPWFTYLATLGHPGIKRIRRTLRFIGIKPKKKKLISKIAPGLRSEKEIKAIIDKIENLGKQGR